DWSISAGSGALSRTLAALSRGSTIEASYLLSGSRGRRRATEPSGSAGRGMAPQGQTSWLFAVCGRATRLSQGRHQPAVPGRGTPILRDRGIQDQPDVLKMQIVR